MIFFRVTSKDTRVVDIKYSEAHVINSTFIENMGRNAGGIGLYNSKGHVINSTLTENMGEWAGGIDLLNSSVHVIGS